MLLSLTRTKAMSKAAIKLTFIIVISRTTIFCLHWSETVSRIGPKKINYPTQDTPNVPRKCLTCVS